MYISEDRYLAHYGVKGMKWGVRHDERRAYSATKKKFKTRDPRKLSEKDQKELSKRKDQDSGSKVKTNMQNRAALRKLDRRYKTTMLAVRDPEARMKLTDDWIRQRSKIDSKATRRVKEYNAQLAENRKQMEESWKQARANTDHPKRMTAAQEKKFEKMYKNPTPDDLEDPSYYRWLEYKAYYKNKK